MGQIPPAEDDPRYEEWRIAQDRLTTAWKYLDGLSHLPTNDPQLLIAHSEWVGAKRVYDAVCAKISN